MASPPPAVDKSPQKGTEHLPSPSVAELLWHHANPDTSGHVNGRDLRPLLLKANVEKQKLAVAWSMVDTLKQGKLNREQLDELLGLIAQVQHDQELNLEAVRAPDFALKVDIEGIQALEQEWRLHQKAPPKASISPEVTSHIIKKAFTLKYKDFIPQELKKQGLFVKEVERWESLPLVLARANEWMHDMRSNPILKSKFQILNLCTMFVDYNETELFKDHSYAPHCSGRIQVVRVFFEQIA